MNQINSSCWPISLAGIAVIAGLTFAGVSVIVRPLEQQRLRRANIEAELAGRQQRANASDRTLRTLQQQLADAQAALRERDLQLKPLPSLNNRMAQITELVEETGMVIHETELGEPETGRFYQRVPITLSGAGNYTECAVFLERVHEGVPDLGVVAFELIGAPGSSAKTQFRFDLEWYAAPAVTAAAE